MAPFETAGLGPSGAPAGGDAGPLPAVLAGVAGGDLEVERPWSPAPPKPIDTLLGKLRFREGLLRARLPERHIYLPNTISPGVFIECLLTASCLYRPNVIVGHKNLKFNNRKG